MSQFSPQISNRTRTRTLVQHISRLVLQHIDLLHHNAAAAVCHYHHHHHGGGRCPAGTNTAAIVLCWSSRRQGAGPPSCLACGAVHPLERQPSGSLLHSSCQRWQTHCCLGLLAVSCKFFEASVQLGSPLTVRSWSTSSSTKFPLLFCCSLKLLAKVLSHWHPMFLSWVKIFEIWTEEIEGNSHSVRHASCKSAAEPHQIPEDTPWSFNLHRILLRLREKCDGLSCGIIVQHSSLVVRIHPNLEAHSSSLISGLWFALHCQMSLFRPFVPFEAVAPPTAPVIRQPLFILKQWCNKRHWGSAVLPTQRSQDHVLSWRGRVQGVITLN